MNATISNTLAADARKSLDEAIALHNRCEAEIAAGRFVYQGPSFVGSEGDGVSSKVASDRALREEYGRAVDRLIKFLDRLVVEHTGFHSFLDLLEAQRSHGYRPSFYEKGNEAIAVLADAYDYVATLWGLPEKSYRPEQPKQVEKKYHLLNDLDVRKATIAKNYFNNPLGQDRDWRHVEGLLARRTQWYTLREIEDLICWLSSSHDDCVDANDVEYTAIEVYTSRKRIEACQNAQARLEALKAAVS